MRRVVACLVEVGQSRLLSGYMLLPCLAVLFSDYISYAEHTHETSLFLWA